MPSDDKHCGTKGEFYIWNEKAKEYVKIGNAINPLTLTVADLEEEKVGIFRRFWRRFKSFLKRILAK